MMRALALAARGRGRTSPNPMVGAIVVDAHGVEAGRGFHAMYGQAHAEPQALDQAGAKAKGGTLYVTLEPCSHQGKTPPCLDRVLQAGLSRVVIASLDPTDKVQSIATLQKAGLDVTVGVLDERQRALNEVFFHQAKADRPFVYAKVAVDRNGVMGLQNRPVMITGEVCERVTMKLRASVDAILVGKGTWQTDDPLLTVRGRYQGHSTTRILLDAKLEMSPHARVVQNTQSKVILVFDPEQVKVPEWIHDHAHVEALPTLHDASFVNIDALLKNLSTRGIQSVLVEGGARLLSSMHHIQAIDRWIVYQSPRDLTQDHPDQTPVRLDQPGFSLDLTSAIRAGQDLVWMS